MPINLTDLPWPDEPTKPVFTQISRCNWCDREARLEFDTQPDEWVLPIDWYCVQRSGVTQGEFCSRNCMVAWILGNV